MLGDTSPEVSPLQHFPLYMWIGKAFEILVIGYSIWRGFKPQRIAAFAMLVAIVLSRLSQDYRFLPGPQYGLAAVDTALFAVFAWLAVRDARGWIIAATGFQLLVAAAHIVSIFAKVETWTYIALLNLLGYLVLASMLVGAWQADRTRRAAESALGPTAS